MSSPTLTRTPSPAAAPMRPSYLTRTEQPTRDDGAVLRCALTAAGATIAALGRAIGVSESRARCWLASINLRHILAAPASVRREIARALVADEAPRSHLPPLAHVARLMSEAGDVARAAVDAGAEVDEAERARLDRELGELGAAVERARADLRGGR